MGIWSDHAVPRIVSVVCNTKHERTIRERVCNGLRGNTLEIGFGSGLNIPFYPPDVSEVWAVDPSEVSRKLAARRIEQSPIPIAFLCPDAQRLSMKDELVDTALSTYTLCTIPDPSKALRELLRVLRPGGTLRFVEHGRSPDAKVARWQDRLEPLQQRIFAGCHLTRDIPELITEAGFVIQSLDQYYAPGAPKFGGFMFEGWATRPATG
jgi:ubiquinone/menaquinone biosynthesis C-methylase UbiE